MFPGVAANQPWEFWYLYNEVATSLVLEISLDSTIAKPATATSQTTEYWKVCDSRHDGSDWENPWLILFQNVDHVELTAVSNASWGSNVEDNEVRLNRSESFCIVNALEIHDMKKVLSKWNEAIALN